MWLTTPPGHVAGFLVRRRQKRSLKQRSNSEVKKMQGGKWECPHVAESGRAYIRSQEEHILEVDLQKIVNHFNEAKKQQQFSL